MYSAPSEEYISLILSLSTIFSNIETTVVGDKERHLHYISLF